MTNPRHFFRRCAAAAIMVLLAACQQVPILPGLSPYRIDIQQGNVVTQDMVAKLKPGMTRQQVRYVMGTPPIVDAFHQDRWDYIYYLNKAGTVTEHRRLILLFEGDTLKRVEGDVIPASADGPGARTASGTASATDPKTNAGAGEKKSADTSAKDSAAEEKGFFGRMLDKLGL